ncbi:MAG TPA: hypothetical protein VFE53_03410 [Mucilaginibacter sp.]|jgi:thiamine biosynthesis lipoprotein ApbE|nr:hypothetical protein [Mucilaginibacter sp.]
MKKLILLVAFMATLAAAIAQPAQKSPEVRAAHITKMLQKRLNLTADQAKQVNDIYLTQATKLDSLRSNLSPDKRLNRLTGRTIVMTTHQNVMAILNDAQKQQYTAWENSIKERQKAKRDTIGARQ